MRQARGSHAHHAHCNGSQWVQEASCMPGCMSPTCAAQCLDAGAQRAEGIHVHTLLSTSTVGQLTLLCVIYSIATLGQTFKMWICFSRVTSPLLLAQAGRGADRFGSPPPIGESTFRSPSAAIGFLLMAQLQFLATLSLVPSVGDSESLLSAFVDNLRSDPRCGRGCNQGFADFAVQVFITDGVLHISRGTTQHTLGSYNRIMSSVQFV